MARPKLASCSPEFQPVQAGGYVCLYALQSLSCYCGSQAHVLTTKCLKVRHCILKKKLVRNVITTQHCWLNINIYALFVCFYICMRTSERQGKVITLIIITHKHCLRNSTP